jgi:hypothetical protein
MIIFFKKNQNINILKNKNKNYIYLFSNIYFICLNMWYNDFLINKNLNFILITKKFNEKINIFNCFIFLYFINKFNVINKNFRLKKTKLFFKNILFFSHYLYFYLKSFFLLKIKKYILLFISLKKNYSKIFKLLKLNIFTLKGTKNYKKIIYKKIK